MAKPLTQIRMHRFRDRAALSFDGYDGETVYITAEQARTMADQLKNLADDLHARSFAESKFHTLEIDPQGRTA